MENRYEWCPLCSTSIWCNDSLQSHFKDTHPPQVVDTPSSTTGHTENTSVNHPIHYNAHPSGVECIDVVEHMSFNVGNAVKYLWRADLKNGLEDLKKAAFYINREIERREK